MHEPARHTRHDFGSRGLVTLGVLAILSCGAACGGKSEDAASVRAEPPNLVAEATILRLDGLELGDRDITEAWQRVGYDLDGVFTDADTATCLPVNQTPSRWLVDGDGGIDNSFAKRLLMFLIAVEARPSEAFGGSSYVSLGADASGTLYLATAARVSFILPLVAARISLPDAEGRVTLAAIMPTAALTKTLRDRADLFLGGTCESGAASTSLDSILTDVERASDLRVDGRRDPAAPCDGVSLAIRFVPAPAATAPTIPAKCQ